jgi:hypothetical protein
MHETCRYWNIEFQVESSREHQIKHVLNKEIDKDNTE